VNVCIQHTHALHMFLGTFIVVSMFHFDEDICASNMRAAAWCRAAQTRRKTAVRRIKVDVTWVEAGYKGGRAS
jgi:hypothetical protein